MTEPHPDDDLLIDLAVRSLSEEQSDLICEHLARCEACRERYSAISDSADHILAAAPQASPPPGFSAAVVQAMGLPAMGLPETPRAADAASRRSRWVIALAAVVVLLGGAAGVLAISGTLSQPVAPVAAAIRTTTGETVGEVRQAQFHDAPVLIVEVDRGVAGTAYTCRLLLEDGSTVDGGTWTMPPSGSATWIVHSPAGVARMELVADGTWASADL